MWQVAGVGLTHSDTHLLLHRDLLHHTCTDDHFMAIQGERGPGEPQNIPAEHTAWAYRVGTSSSFGCESLVGRDDSPTDHADGEVAKSNHTTLRIHLPVPPNMSV